MTAREVCWCLVFTVCSSVGCAESVAMPQDAAHGMDSGDASADASNPDICEAQPDGSTCGDGDECNDRPVCMQGRCVARPRPNGTACASTVRRCVQWTCQSGVCATAGNLPDGTVCSPAADACHTDGLCQAGN